MLSDDNWLAPVEVDSPKRLTGGENYYEYHTDTLWIASGEDWVSTHELNHFFQHCGTPYGFFLQNLVDAQNRCVTDYISQFNSLLPNDPILVPVYPLAAEIKNLRSGRDFTSSIPSLDTVESLLKTYIYPWSRLRFLENIFEGRDIDSVRKGSLLKSVQALHQYESMFERGISEEDWLDSQAFINGGGDPNVLESSPHPVLTSSTIPPDKLACPIGKWAEKVMPLGGEHIMEGIAQQTQRSFLEKGATPDERSLNVNYAQYWFLWHITLERYAAQFGADFFRDREKFLERTNQAYCTFIALSELALFVPAGFVYNRLRSPQTEWNDIHPTRRFFKALSATPQVGWMDNLLPESIEAFQNKTCAVLGWACPRDFLLLGSSLKLDIDVIQRHKEACKLRLENPAGFVTLLPKDFYKDPDAIPFVSEYLKNPNRYTFDKLIPFVNYGNSISHSDFLKKHPPIIYHAQSDETLVPSFQESQASNKLIRYFLSNWCLKVMVEGVPSYESLLPPKLRFDNIFSNVNSMQQYLDLIIRDNPWLNPQRLKKRAKSNR